MDSVTWNWGRRRRTSVGGYYHRGDDDDVIPTTAPMEGAFSSTVSPLQPGRPVSIDLNRSPPPDAAYDHDPQQRLGGGIIPVADDDSIDLNRTPQLEISHDSNLQESHSSNVMGITGAADESRNETAEQTHGEGSLSPMESSTREIISPHPRIFGISFVNSKPRSRGSQIPNSHPTDQE